MIDIPNWVAEALIILAIGAVIVSILIKVAKCFMGDNNAD